ncbi:MAG: type II toxin-antitoxin system HicA family toxin [Spirochaetota bacterium]
MYMTGKEVIKKLEAAGFVLKSVKGSHHKMSKGNLSVPVPVHGKKDLGKGLLKEISKQSGVKL